MLMFLSYVAEASQLILVEKPSVIAVDHHLELIGCLSCRLVLTVQLYVC